MLTNAEFQDHRSSPSVRPPGHGTPPPDVIERLGQLCDRALFVQAHELARPFAPIARWEGTAPRIMAARLAHHLGAPRLSNQLVLRAYRRAPRDPEAILFWAYGVSEMRGPFELWRRIGALTLPAETPPETRARLTRLRAIAAAILRDFDGAAALLDQAEREHPRDAAGLADRAAVLEREDRYEEALAAAREALALDPLHRQALLRAAQLLALLDRGGEAIDLLAAADAGLECGEITLRLAALQVARERHEDARRSLDRFAELSPLLDDEGARALAARRSDCAYRLGDMATAIAEAERSGAPFFAWVVERLRKRREGRRVRLDVGFVRQHHLTCVPATLTILARFWDRPAEHLEIAEAICYDGTPAHSERRWAEENGFATRELTVTWESAVALLDRGVPFILSTSFASSGHAQLVIGYDDRRGTLDVRDPYVHVVVEAAAEPFLARFRATGPHGLVLVPREEEHRLADLDLPDAALYDTLHRLDRALSEHDRAAAASALARLEEQAPCHALTIRGQRALAAYDADPAGVRRAAEAQLALFPDDGSAELAVLACMHETGSREARIARLEVILARGPAEAIFVEQLAAELAGDARERARAARLLRQVLRFAPERAEPYAALSAIAEEEGRAEDALALSRFGACVEPTREVGPRAYFVRAWQQGRAEEAITLLERRDVRLGGRSGRPAATLFEALAALDRQPAAFAALERAIARRPDDGELLLFAAAAHARYGRFERARELLAAAGSRARRASWLRVAAELAERAGAPDEALARWREILDLEPFAEDAHRAVAELLAGADGDEAARAHVAAACARFPHHHALIRLRIELLRDQAPEAREVAVRGFLELEPGSAWALRELSECMLLQRRLDQAREAQAAAQAVDPSSVPAALTSARLALREGDRPRAREALRELVRRTPDAGRAIAGLFATARTIEEIGADLALVEREVLPRTGTGEGVVAWYAMARTVRPAESLRAPIEALRASRPGVREIWSVAYHNLVDLDLCGAARALAEQASARFPLAPEAWLELAEICRFAGDTSEEIAALDHALALGRALPDASVQLARAHRRERAPQRVRCVLEEGLVRAPRAPALLLALAGVQWRDGARAAAIARLERLVAITPDSEYAWAAFAARCLAAGEPDRAVELIRAIAARRPWDAEVQLRLGERLAAAGRPEEALAAAAAALALDPRLVAAHDLRAVLLAGLGRPDEARAACAPPVFPEGPPLELRARAALLEASAGRVTEAIAHLHALGAERPGFAFVWAELAGLHRAARQPVEELVAARALVRAAPRSAGAYAVLADACLHNQDQAGAVEACQRAFALDPDYTPTALALVDLLVEARKKKRARSALEAIEPFAPPALLTLRRARVALLEGDRDGAEGFVRALCLDPATPEDALYDAINALFQAGARPTGDLLDALVDEPGAHPEMGAIWAKAQRKMGYRPAPGRLRALVASRGELGYRAVAATFDALGDAGAGSALLWRLLWLRAACEADLRCWAQAGASLAAAGLHLAAAAWLGSYRRRAGVTPWQLVPLVNALRSRLRTRRALAVSRYALTLPADDSTPLHRMWVAFEAAVAGERLAAEEAIDGVPAAALGGTAGEIHGLVRAMLTMQEAPARKRPAALARARAQLVEARRQGAPPGALSPIGDAHQRALRRVVADAGYPLEALAQAYPAWIVFAFVAIVGSSRIFQEPDGWIFPVLAALTAVALIELRWLLARV